MMGLLDSNDLTDDPRTQGLLSLGLRLLSSQGKFGPALGQAGLGAMGDLQAAQRDRDTRKRAGLQDQMLMMQMDQAKRQQAAQEAAAMRKAKDDELLAGAFRPMPGPMPDGTAGVMPRFDVQRLLGSGLSMDSVPEAMKLQQLLNPPRKLRDVAGGASVIDEANPGVPLFTAPKEDKQSPVGELLAEMGRLPPGDPRRATYLDAIKKATTHQEPMRLSIDQRQPGAFATAQGKEFSDMMGSINKQSFTAPAQLAKLDRMSALLDGVEGGKLSPAGVEVASMANSLGIKLDPKLGNKQAAQALAIEMANGMRQPGTGVMTDADFNNFLRTVPDLSKSAEGRRQITKTMKAALKRDVEIGNMAREYVKQNGQLDNGFLQRAAQYMDQNPVVSNPSSAANEDDLVNKYRSR